MKQITLDGRLGGDAEVKKTNTGKDYVRFEIANDSFVDGANKTEWFNVTCFDPFIVSKKSEFLKKGRYVIISGTWKSEVTNNKGTIYLNHYITANNIELPSFGSKKENSNEVQISTFTGGTKSAETAKAPVQEVQQVPVQQPTPAPQPQAVAAQAAPAGWNNDDDLPF
jgi:single stranded DNA-binding protein